MTMKEMLIMLVEDFNSYSELVALNYSQMRDGTCDEGTLQWNRGSLNKIEEHAEAVAKALGAELRYECKEHVFGWDDWKRTLEYRTVRVVFAE